MDLSRGRAGSIVLLVAAFVVLVRPWEGYLGAGEPGQRAVSAYVTRVVDGDTLEVRIGDEVEDVRLIGVDTPETVDPDTQTQCFGPRASRFAHRLVEHERLRLVLGVERRDTYGRLLAYAYVGHKFVNAELVRRGLARTLTIPPNSLHRALFERLQLRAARTGRGLWGACPA
jgi:micrococcal nuclease